jgi:hypothetical protein
MAAAAIAEEAGTAAAEATAEVQAAAIDAVRARKSRTILDVPQRRLLRAIPDFPGICGANLESLQNAAFPFASGRGN